MMYTKSTSSAPRPSGNRETTGMYGQSTASRCSYWWRRQGEWSAPCPPHQHLAEIGEIEDHSSPSQQAHLKPASLTISAFPGARQPEGIPGNTTAIGRINTLVGISTFSLCCSEGSTVRLSEVLHCRESLVFRGLHNGQPKVCSSLCHKQKSLCCLVRCGGRL